MTGERGRVRRAPAEAGHRRLRRPKAARTAPAGGSLTVESLTKMLGAAALLAYAAGLLVVNAYLLQFEVSDFGLFRARFVLTGTLFLSVVALATFFPVAAVVLLVGTWGRSPWWLRHPPVARGALKLDFTMGAAILVCLPFAIYRIGLRQSTPDSLALYFVAAAMGGLVLLAGWLVASRHRRDRGASNPFPAWTSVAILSVLLLPYSFLVVSTFATDVYPDIPEQLGGARPVAVTLLVEKDAVESVRALGLNVAADGTAEVRLLFHGEGFYVVARPPAGSLVLRSDVVLGVARSDPLGI